MSLTLPRAGRIAGRAPELRVPTPQIGEDIARLGNVMAQVGGAIEAERNDRLFSRAQIDMMDGFNRLRLDLDQIGDPDARAQIWTQRVGELRRALVDGLPAGIRDRAELRFEDMRARTEYAEGRDQWGLAQSQRRADLARAHDVTLSMAATGAPEEVDAAFEGYRELLQRQVSAGVITPERAEQDLSRWLGDYGQSRAEAMLRDDPQALLDGLDSPDFQGLSPQQRESWRTRATARLEQASTEAQSALGRELREVRSVLLQGYEHASAERLAADPAVADHPDGPAFLATVRLRQQLPGFEGLPPATMREMLAEREAQPIQAGRDDEIALRGLMRDAIERAEENWARDPIGHATRLGRIDAVELPDLASAAPEDIARVMMARSAQADALVRRGYTDAPVLFTPDEREQLRAATSIEAHPDQRARLAAAAMVAFGEDTPDLVGQISDDPVFRHVGGLVASGGSQVLAREIFEGQRALAGRDVPVPSEAARRHQWFVNFDGLFDNFAEGAMRDEIIASADALYAYRMRTNPNASDADVRAQTWLQSAHEVVGGTGTFDGTDARGGIQALRGQVTFIPPGMRASDVERQLNTLGRGLSYSGDYLEFGPEAETWRNRQVDMGRTWQRFSHDGAAPVIGGEVIDAGTIGAVALHAVGPDTYVLHWTNAEGQREIVFGDNGLPYRMSLRALMEWQP